MSMATTRRAIFAIGSVNQPSPAQRSIASIPGASPTARSTPAGSRHSACHQAASGISVPSKKSGCFSIATFRNIREPGAFRRPAYFDGLRFLALGGRNSNSTYCRKLRAARATAPASLKLRERMKPPSIVAMIVSASSRAVTGRAGL